MASKVQICNLALSRLGANILTSLGDRTPEADLCSTFFDDLADRAMLQGSWSSTIKTAALAATTTTPPDFSSEFQLPVDPKALRVLNVIEDKPGEIIYRIRGDKLVTDESSITIRYIGRLTDTEAYGPLLTEAIEILLTSYLALPITGQASLATRFKEEYLAMIDNNLALDGQQGSKNVTNVPDLIEIR